MEANPYYLRDTDGGYYNKYPEFEVYEEGRRAGIKTVVDWIETKGTNTSDGTIYSFWNMTLQAKLKEWEGK